MSTSRQSAFPCINKTNEMVSINSDTFLKKSNTNSRRRSGASLGTSSEMDPCPRCFKTYSFWTIFVLSVFIASLFLPIGAASLPFRDSETCGPIQCKAELDAKDEMKFHYKGGSIYSYQYVVNGTTVVLGGPPTQSGLHLSAKVTIRFLTACDAILFIKDTEVWQSYFSSDKQKGTPGNEPSFKQPKTQLTFIKSLEQYPLRFSYGDGLIEEICPHSEESSWALNIKRGFLSAFQNTMRRLDLEHKGEEDDVHGKCKVQYSLGTATSSALTIEKVKDLKSCGDKFGILSSIQGTPYNFGTLHQSMPAVVSTSECQHIVDRNLLSKAQCLESHKLQSLARGVSGTYMNIRQSLELVEVYVPPLVPSYGSSSNSSSGLSPFDEDDETEDDEDEEEDKNKQNPGQLDEEDKGNAPWIITRNPNAYTSLLINKTPEIISRRESLFFRHDFNLGRPSSDFSTAQTLLSHFCKAVKSDVEPKAGSLFFNLVQVLRGLTFDEMMRLSKDAIQLCQNDRNPFDDILEAIGTASSVGVIKERILRREATSDRITSWINSLTFISKPDLAVLNSAVILLKARDEFPNILLTLSSLTHSYCGQVGREFCLKQQPVAILAKLYDRYFAATMCATKKRKETDQTLMYLKGIGNFGMHTEGISNALQTCIKKNDKNEIRVAALEAYRRMSCEAQQRDVGVFKMLFENQSEDSEIRIAAFLSIMRCPSYPTIRWIRDALDREEVNQVGSFVWTYLTNLQETALPSKAELQGLLQDEILSSKFTPDIRKFSRNFELSSFYEDANLGIGVDGNLIFSQTSYLPRSASMNLTVDLFGESVNVFESTLRVESLEHYVESIFGPNGKLSKPSNLTSSLQKGKRRVRRATPSKRKIRTLALEHQAIKRYYADPIASLSFRAFGNEIYYKRAVGLTEQMNMVNTMNPFKAFSSLANQKDTNWQKSRLLLDSAYIIPTGVGFPLNLSAQASSIMRFEIESLIDSSSDGFKLKGKLIPSAVLTVAGSMTLSVSDIHSGLKIEAHLRSSTAVEGTFHIQQMNLLDVEFGLPKNQLEILQYRSDVMFMDGDDFRPVGHVETEQNPLCTGGLFHTYLGLRLCSSSFFSLHPSPTPDKKSQRPAETDEEEDSHPALLAPYFPLNGPSYFTLTFDKANPSLLKTRFNYVWNNNQTATVLTLMGTTLTGDSRTSAATSKLGLDFKYDKSERAFQLGIATLTDQFKASGQLPSDLSRGDLDVSLNQNLSPVFTTSASFKKTVHSSGKSAVKPSLTVHRRGAKILEANGELEITPSSDIEDHSDFNGKGQFHYNGKKSYFSLDGIHNITSFAINLQCDFWNGETLKWSSVQKKLQGKDESGRGGGGGGWLHSQMTLELSESPQYNTVASWKYQTSDDGWEHEGEFSQGPNFMRKGKDTSNLWIRVGGLLYRSHEGSRNKWLCLVNKPTDNIDWGFEASLNTIGKSQDAMLNLRYAPEKTVETSLSVKRSPGILTQAQVEWNITIPNHNPLQVAFNLEEKAHRTYQAQFKTDWFRDRLILDFEYTDRSRKTKIDTSISLGVTTTAIDNLKLSFHCLSDDKETKINFDTDYKNKRNTFELGHSQVGRVGRKHKLHASLSLGDLVYVLMTEVDLENGFQCVVKTDLGSKFSDIYARVRATNQNGMQIFSLEYSWDATRDRSKKFLLECLMDASRLYTRRTEALLVFPHQEYLLAADYQLKEEERTVSGKVSWKKDEDGGHLHLNGRLGPRRRSSDSDDEAYDAVLQVATPFPAVKNVSLNLGLDFLEDRSVCKINFEGSWGDDGNMRGTVHSLLEPLSSNEVEQDEIDNDNENLDAPHEQENEIQSFSKELWKKFKFRLVGNITTSIKNYQVVNLRVNHIHHSFLSLKTDVDIQFPTDKEINLSTQWNIPQSWSDILSTRAEVHFKSPFIGFQNLDAQLVLGGKEDRDVLAIVGIYWENFQYAISITGTPRFKEDGTLGFEVITSNPNSDKIFGSFSYVIGDNARIACQLGWPQIVIGLETGYEWAGWEEFQVYFTFNSPWMPAKHIDARVKVDGAQFAEFKLEMNEDTIDAKSEWAVVSWTNFDIRFNANSPFEDLAKIGFVLRNSWDDEVTYHSQCLGWVNDQQVGYKLEGGTTDIEEAEVVAIVMHSQLEIDTIVYPTIRGVFSLTTREARFNVAASLTLKEGPINIEGQLDLLDVFRFNENVTITTPYPGLFELELNLSPAIVFESDLYNLALQSKWRSGSEWYESGLVIRAGPQGVLSDILTQEAQDALDLSEPSEDDERQEEATAARVTVPMSQLLHFYSPLTWAKIIKLEYETSSHSREEEEADEDVEETHEGPLTAPNDVFPIRNFIAVYSADVADLSASLQNEKLSKKLTGVVDIRGSSDFRLSVKLDGALDLSDPEKKLTLVGGSYYPRTREYSLETCWTNGLPQYLQGKTEIKTPLEEWEEQQASVMYAHNEDEKSYSVDFELTSLALDKVATNVALGPRHFSMTLNTPFQGFQEVEMRGDTTSKDDDESELNTIINIKSGEKEIEIDVNSSVDDQGWPTQIQGSLSTTLGLQPVYRQGDLKADVEKGEDGVNVNGEIEWKNNQRVRAILVLSLPRSRFQELNITVDTPFKHLENWNVWLHQEAGEDQFSVQLQAATPLSHFSTLEAKGILEYETSLWKVTQLGLRAKAPLGSAQLKSNWTLNKWNDFGWGLESKYSLNPNMKTDFSSLDSLQNENGLRCDIANFIALTETSSQIDSRLNFQIAKPSLRVGGGISSELINGESFALKLSSDYGKTHYKAAVNSQFDENFQNMDSQLQFNSSGQNAKTYNSNLKWKRETETSIDGELQVEWGSGGRILSSVQSTFNCSWPVDNDANLHLRVGYPSSGNTNTADSSLISIDGSSNRISSRHSARFQFGADGTEEKPWRFDALFIIPSLKDFTTALNLSSNLELVSEVGVHVSNKIDGSIIDGVIGGNWEADKLLLDYYWDYENSDDLFKVNSSLEFEIPIPTESVPKPQTGFLMLHYQSQPTVSESDFKIVYNGVELGNGSYSFSSEESAGSETEQRHLTFANHFWPFGLDTLYQFEYSGGHDGLNLPTKTVRRLEVYDLGQPDLHKLEGELQIKTNFTGSEITVTGKHPSKEIQFLTDYDFLDHQFKHTSQIVWSQDSSVAYELGIMNTTNDKKTGKELDFRLTYPIRMITLHSGYILEGSSLNWTTEMNFNASKSDRKLVGVVTWNVEEEKKPSGSSVTDRQVGITVRHPSLLQDLRAEGQLQTDGWDLIEGKVWMDYTGDLNKGVTLLVRTQPEFELPYWNVSTDIRLHHSATNLDVKTLLSTRNSPHELSIITLIDFKNSKKSLAQESKIAFELFKQLRKAHIMMVDPEDHLSLEGQVSGHYPMYVIVGSANYTGAELPPQMNLSLDLDKPFLKLYAVHGKDLSNGIYAEGGVLDSRNVKFDIWEQHDNLRYSDVSYFLRMNHSKLITSKLKWRPELFTELQELGTTFYRNVSRIITQKSEHAVITAKEDAWESMTAIWNDAKEKIEPFLMELREECDFRNDSAALQFFFEEMQRQNDYYVQDILGFSQLFLEEISMRISLFMEKLKTYREEGNSDSLRFLEKAYTEITEKIQALYTKVTTKWNNFWSNPWPTSEIIPMDKIKEYTGLILYYSVGFVVKLSGEIYGALSSLATSVLVHLGRLVERYQPEVLTYIHQLQAFVHDFIVKASEYIRQTKEDIMKSPYYQKLAALAGEVEKVYRELTEADATTNIKKFYAMIKTYIHAKLKEIDEFVIPLGQLGTKLQEIWEKLRRLEWILMIQDYGNRWWNKMKWVITYTNLDETLQDLLVLFCTKGSDLFSQTVLEAGGRHQNAKTKFVFDADKGIISLEQKLPMPWAAFNETPDFQRLPEYQYIVKLQDWFGSSKGSIWDVYYKIQPIKDISNWLPPFDGHAMLVGHEFFFTFDGLAYNFTGSCVYLLAADLVDGNFSVSLQYNNASSSEDSPPSFTIIVTAGHKSYNTLIIDMDHNGLKDGKRGSNQILNLPVQMQNLQGFRDGERLVVESPKGVSVSCNMVYRICQLWVSGWYSRKTSGLLGTMDEEPTSDMTMSNGRKSHSIGEMVKSFDVSDDSSPENCPVTDKILTVSNDILLPDSSKNAYTCDKLFSGTMSSLQPCFSTIPVDPYLAMCSSTRDSVCRAAMSYASACNTQGVSVKVPSLCIKCDMNGEEMIDRDMKVISSPPAGSPTFRSTDVVFIIEAKDCNRPLRTRKKIDALAKSLEDEFIQNNFKENRYATILFGGDGVLDKPHPVVQDNKIFTSYEEIGKHMASLAIGNGSQDIFNGIAYALHRLNFRPGVSKTFILFPCSSCQPEHMKTMDYADIHYALMEQGATLHVMLNDEFNVDSKTLSKNLFGLDNSAIFTKSDGVKDKLRGDATSRRQVKVSRKVLGYCTALALQTNGTIFNGKKLYNKRDNVVELFTKVVSRRIVLTASPADCQTCYCTRNDYDGVGKIECYVCGYPRYNTLPEDEDNFRDVTENLLSQNSINTISTADTETDEGFDEEVSEEDEEE